MKYKKILDAMNVNSVTKGVMGLLAGIALDKACIRNLDQKVMEHLEIYCSLYLCITDEGDDKR